MKTKLNINALLTLIPDKATYITTGLTNDNYIVSSEDSKYVVRIPKPHNSHLFDYHLESLIIDKIQELELDVPTLFYDKETGIKISQYIDGAAQFKIDDYQKVPALLKKLHNANLQCGKRYDIQAEYQKYTKDIKEPLFDLEPFTHYISDTYNLSSNWRLCHNDLVPGNLLFTSKRSYLIDYEYACDNDPVFDVMSFITENNINDKSIRQDIYNLYFEKPLSKELTHKLHVFECALDTLWCAWAMRMYELESQDVFKKIAIDKYLNLLRAIRIYNK